MRAIPALTFPTNGIGPRGHTRQDSPEPFGPWTSAASAGTSDRNDLLSFASGVLFCGAGTPLLARSDHEDEKRRAAGLLAMSVALALVSFPPALAAAGSIHAQFDLGGSSAFLGDPFLVGMLREA